MKSARARVCGVLGVVALVAALLLPGSASAVVTNYEVQIGGRLGDLPAESLHFFPSSLKVHRGDVIHFKSDLFHTVTILTAGQDPDTWLAANWKGSDKPWSVAVREPDEQDSLKVNRQVLAPSHPCGWPDQVPCPYAGVGDPTVDILHSGLPLNGSEGDLQPTTVDYTVEVRAAPGTTLWALSLVHPSLRMKIEVVGDGEAATTLEAAAAESDQLRTADRDEAEALLNRFRSRNKVTKLPRGRQMKHVWAGVDTANVSLLGFYPDRVTIKEGDKVRWHFDRLRWRVEGVVFPMGQGLAKAAEFPRYECDLDTDAQSAPDQAAVTTAFPYCAEAEHLELEVNAALALKRGDNAHRSYGDIDWSGVRGGGGVVQTPYTLKFTHVSRKGFKYIGSGSAFGGTVALARVIVEPRR